MIERVQHKNTTELGWYIIPGNELCVYHALCLSMNMCGNVDLLF